MTDTRCLSALRFTIATATVCLVTSTWPLWTGSTSFPQIPFLESLCATGNRADIAGLALILSGAVSTLTGSGASLFRTCRARLNPDTGLIQRLEQFGPWLLAAGLGLSTLLNQHRLQPWTWHFFVLCPLTASHPQPGNRNSSEQSSRFTFTAVTVLTASIYLFSGFSKLDAGFSATCGQQLVESLLSTIGMSTRFWPDSTKTLVAQSLPLGELIIGLLFLLRRWSLGVSLSILMHVLLLFTLGPFGMQHRPAVLIWNTSFIVQNLILWRWSQRPHRAGLSVTAESSGAFESATWFSNLSQRIPRAAAVSLLLFAISIPFLRPFGLCDPWLAWAVYASQPARVTVLADETAAATLPAELQAFLQPRQLDNGQVFVRIDQWSIRTTGAPVCPGDRFSVAIARSLSDHTAGRGQMSLVVEDAAGWRDGKRNSRQYHGQREIAEYADSFRLNTRSRNGP